MSERICERKDREARRGVAYDAMKRALLLARPGVDYLRIEEELKGIHPEQRRWTEVSNAVNQALRLTELV